MKKRVFAVCMFFFVMTMFTLFFNLQTAVAEDVKPQEVSQELPVKHIPNIPKAAESYFSPDSKSLICQAQFPEDAKKDPNAYHAYTANIDGTNIFCLNNKGEDACNYFCPDGKHIVWTSTKDHLDMPKGNWSDPKDYPQGAELYMSDLDGKNEKRLTNNNYYDAEVTVSPDGKWILFGRQINGMMDLWKMNFDGTGETQITHTPDWQEGGANYMSDSKTILTRAWKKEDEGKPSKEMQIFTIKDDGTGTLTQITKEGFNWAPFPHPDGKHFAFVKILPAKTHPGPNFEIYMMNMETGKQTRLTYTDAFDGFPSISPDGKMMMFSSSRNAPPGERTLSLFIMDISSFKD
ncbi:MAG: PD40 domain-containing protein [Candidatus Schekmanbacteria bacterium]|nr:PD40 domain-containing protein [Candidatus Schekmanbacteria bacterium]